MIVFPVLNFVLPLMLTSLLLVNTQDCNKCNGNKDLKVNENVVLDVNYESNKLLKEKESTEERYSKRIKKGNVR